MHPYFDLNDDEREEYRHQELIHQCSQYNPYTQHTAHIYRKAHERIYGKDCRFCMEPHMKFLEKAFNREPLEPTTTLEAKRADKSNRRTNPGLQDLLDEIMGRIPKE